ncbi:MAG: glycosyltransferase, partial [Clostridia bacterium]
MDIIALVVTYNRKELLCECIDAILAQTCLPKKIVILDNASTDGTADLFKENGIYNIPIVEYIISKSNTGGAGGFYQGIKHCMKESDWIWIMDDDTIPDKNALKGLCESLNDLSKEKISFLASKVIGPNGEAMNLPQIDMTPSENGYPDWYMYLENKLIKIKTATFVSLLINTKAIKEVGLPLSWYFIWGDDTEYTLRLT